jgi:diguanylate cyclase (GGDEF)-like protein/PAS domain S-box-containing protein
MQDEHKTNKQLINELKGLRQEIIILKAIGPEHRPSKHALPESEKLFRMAVTNAPIVFFIVDRNGIFTLSEGKGLEALGLKPGEVVGQSVFDIYRDDPAIVENMKRAMGGKEINYIVEVGRLLFETMLIPVIDHKGEVSDVVGVATDITERKQLEKGLKEIVMTDRLTQAHNRLKYDGIIAGEMERAKRFNRPLSMVMLDIDYFKKVNDTFGHSIGDYVLKALADIVRKHMRKVNHFIRWGGEEFMIIAVETDLKGAAVLSERIRKAIVGYRFDKVGKITASFGVTQFKDDDTAGTFMRRADDALYQSKENGRNRVETSA